MIFSCAARSSKFIFQFSNEKMIIVSWGILCCTHALNTSFTHAFCSQRCTHQFFAHKVIKMAIIECLKVIGLFSFCLGKLTPEQPPAGKKSNLYELVNM